MSFELAKKLSVGMFEYLMMLYSLAYPPEWVIDLGYGMAVYAMACRVITEGVYGE